MHRDDSDQRRRQRRRGRRGIVAMLAVTAGLVLVCAAAATRSDTANAPHVVSSGSMLAANQAPVTDATIAQTATHIGQFVTAHRPTLAAISLSLLLLLPLLLRSRRHPPIPVAATPRRFRGGTPLRRGPPTFLAR